MIQYNSIPHFNSCKLLGQPVFSFYKYDGSNLRFEWQPKKGFFKFGSRTQLIDKNSEIFGCSIEQFQDTMSKDILSRMEDFYSKKVINNLDRIVAFCEFFGENSVAGTHDINDEKYLKLFDIHMFKKGFIPPKEFVEIFEGFEHSAELLYYGNLNQDYIKEVQLNEDMKLKEGVICKGVVKGQVEMTKIKTNAWLEMIKGKFENWEKLV